MTKKSKLFIVVNVALQGCQPSERQGSEDVYRRGGL